MTVLSRGARGRRGGRRPGWLLLTVLLVLAIAASSALVFTNRVELLKLAVILALWAAVVAAFVSVIYRRQSDADQAKVRDLKLVYDLQLDREISARREYELTVETQLRRELASELRAQSADEVAALRAELAALRTNLEILFDTDLSHRPAIETDRAAAGAYAGWARDPETTGRVSSSRIDTDDRVRDDRDDVDDRTEESPIIDVPAEPHPPAPEWVSGGGFAGAHRLGSEAEEGRQDRRGRRHRVEDPYRAGVEDPYRAGVEDPYRAPADDAASWHAPEQPPWAAHPAPEPVTTFPEPEPAFPEPERAFHEPEPEPAFAEPEREPEPAFAEPEPEAEAEAEAAPTWTPPVPEPTPGEDIPPSEWRPAPAEGQWIPAGAPGSNWVAPVSENGTADYVGRRRAPEPAMSAPPHEPPKGKHSVTAGEADADADAERVPAPPVLAAESAQPPPHPEPAAEAGPELESESADDTIVPRHRTPEEADDSEGQHTGGHSVADLLARLQASPTGGGRRRRRDE
ncbi:MAG: hypothetical protein JST91_16520 [Actinobacteria bacterium]|nr:hypothetical protein [Actinomycetota bacterium]